MRYRITLPKVENVEDVFAKHACYHPSSHVGNPMRYHAIQKKKIYAFIWHIIATLFIHSVIYVFSYFWEIFMIVVFVLYLFSVPYLLLYVANTFIMTHYSLIMNIICLTNISLNFATGYFESSIKQIVLDPRKIAINYLKTYFTVDILASFPFGYVCYLFGVSDLSIRTAASLNLLHVYSLMQYMDRFRQKRQFSLYKYKTLQIVTIYIFGYNWIMCFIGFSVIYDLEIAIEELDLLYCVRTSLYLVFGLGQSNFILYDTEMIVHSLSMIFATVMRIILMAHIILFFKSSNALQRKYTQMMGEVEEFVHFKSVPKRMRIRMQNYYYFIFHDKYYDETEVWCRVSDRMKAIVHFRVLTQCLNSDIFQLCPNDTLLTLMNYLQRRIVLPYEVIYKCGSTADYLYVLHCGTVALYTLNGREVACVEEGNIFGDCALLSYSNLRRFTVIALECCEIFRLQRKYFLFALQYDMELTNNIQEVLERRRDFLDML